MNRYSITNDKWRKNNPLKAKAHWIVQSDVRQGKLVMQPCIECGELPTHAHHNDYSKPHNVEWLCEWHHYNRHHPNAIRRNKHIVRNRVKLRGVDSMSTRYNKSLKEYITLLVEEGYTYKAIGIIFSLSKSQICKIYKNTDYK